MCHVLFVILYIKSPLSPAAAAAAAAATAAAAPLELK